LQDLVIHELFECSFCGLDRLKHLNITNNDIEIIKGRTFKGLNALENLLLMGNDIVSMHEDSMRELSSLKLMSVDKKRWCCFSPNQAMCVHSHNDMQLLSSCEHLVASYTLRTLIWLVVIFIFSSNVYVICFWSFRWRNAGKISNHNLSVVSLALSDILIAMYLGIIGSASLYYEGIFIKVEEDWKSSILCEMASMLSLLSLEMSVFSLFMSSVEKLHVFLHPFQPTPFSSKTIVKLFLLVWILFSSLSSCLTFIILPVPNSLCLPYHFHITDDGRESKFIVISILILGLVFLIGILFMNVATITILKQSQKAAGRRTSSKDKVALIRTILASSSNFLSWVVVVPVALMSLSGYELQSDIMAWVAIVGLPLNSILNPAIYTFSTSAFLNHLKNVTQPKAYSQQEKTQNSTP